MTVSGHLGAIPDFQKLYDNCHFIPYWWVGEGIIKVDYCNATRGLCVQDILHTTTKAKKRFFNQLTLVFRLAMPRPGPVPTSPAFKEVNIKLFKNGGFQMTGISSETMARAALERMIALNYDGTGEGARGIWTTQPHIQKFQVCMMNSDYNVGKAIRRDRLYRILVEEYGLCSTFEPTIYQGVNTKFFWNSERPAAAPPGICICPTPCEGDGDGYGIGQCKKITISPFRPGSIIITGAKCEKQLMDAYDFMNGVLSENEELVLRDEPVAEVKPVRTKKAATTTAAVTEPGLEEQLRVRMRGSPRNVVRIVPGTTA
jgi:hypothetical protein